MNKPLYIYRVSACKYSIFVEVAVFDPNRWKNNPIGLQGGARFGFEAEVHCSKRGYSDQTLVAEVSMGAIGSHSPADARLRMDVYAQAAQIAEFINDMLAAGETLEWIGAFLDANLAQDRTKPAEKPFHYGKGGGGLRTSAA